MNTFEVTTDAVADAYNIDVYSLALSPDGTTLAVVDTIDRSGGPPISQLRLWNIETGELIKTFRPRSDTCSSISSVAFSPDGKSVAFNECFGVFSLVDIASGRLLPISEEIGVASSFAFNPDGTQLVVKAARGDAAVNPITLELWSLEGSLLGTLEDQDVSSGGGLFAFSPDGSRLAVSNAYGTVSVLNVSVLASLLRCPKSHLLG